jgi:hypothetical protein
MTCSIRYNSAESVEFGLANQLTVFKDQEDIQLSIYMDTSVPPTCSPLYCINVYCPRDAADIIGDALGDRELHLQTPQLLNLSVHYHNPQTLRRDARDLTPCIATKPSVETQHGVDCIHTTDNPGSFFKFSRERGSSGIKLVA